MGAIGGGIFQAVKGFRNAPSVSCPFNKFIFLCLKSVCYGGILSGQVNVIHVVLNSIATVDCTICSE